MTPRNIRAKKWFSEAMPLDKLIEDLTKIRDQLSGKPCKVIGVFNPAYPTEAEIVNVSTRRDALDAELGDHLNALAGQVTDIELEDSAADNAFELKRDGDVVYICLGWAAGKASKTVYEV